MWNMASDFLFKKKKKSRESQKMNDIHEQQKRTVKDTIHDDYCPRWCVLCFHSDSYNQQRLLLHIIRINRNGVCCKTAAEFLRVLFVNVRLQKISRHELYLQCRQFKEHSLNAMDPTVYDSQVLYFAWCGKQTLSESLWQFILKRLCLMQCQDTIDRLWTGILQ